MITCGRGDPSKQYQVDGEQAFLYMLEREHCASKYSMLEFTYGDSWNSICEQSLAAERWLVDNHEHRLHDLGFFVNLFPAYAQCIRRRIERNGDIVPPEGRRCIGFVDRVSMQIARPRGNWQFQRMWYGFKSGFHNFAYQSLYTPDGMHAHFCGPAAGRANDRLLMMNSNLESLLEALQQVNGRLVPRNQRYFAYTDRGYDSDRCIHAAHHGIYVTAQQVIDNHCMSPVRVCVEWGFARLRAMSKLLDTKWNMKMQASAVDYHVKSAVLLSNARTCLQAGQNTSYFDVEPPTLESYFL